MITITKEYVVVHAAGLADPEITLEDFFVSLDGGVSYQPANQKQDVNVGQPFLVAFNWTCTPLSGYRASVTFTVEVYRDGTLKQTLAPMSYTIYSAYASSELINFPNGVDEEGDWTLKVRMSGVTLQA